MADCADMVLDGYLNQDGSYGDVIDLKRQRAPKQDKYSKQNVVNGIDSWLYTNCRCPKNTQEGSGAQKVMSVYATFLNKARKYAYIHATNNFKDFTQWAKENFPNNYR